MCVCDYVVTGVECEEESVTCCDLSPLHLWSVSCFIPSVCLTQSERAVETLIRRTERERESERERERDMSVSTQLGLLLWKNFTYRRRQTVSHTCTCTHCCTCIITFFLIHKNDLMETDLHLWKKKAAGI